MTVNVRECLANEKWAASCDIMLYGSCRKQKNKTHTSLEQCVTENSSFIFKPWTPAHSE